MQECHNQYGQSICRRFYLYRMISLRIAQADGKSESGSVSEAGPNLRSDRLLDARVS